MGFARRAVGGADSDGHKRITPHNLRLCPIRKLSTNIQQSSEKRLANFLRHDIMGRHNMRGEEQ